MKIDKVAAAIEADAGMEIPGLLESLTEMKADTVGREYTPEQILVLEARKSMKMSQPRFAEVINTSVGTLRDWEQGRSPLPGAAKRLFQISLANPGILETD